jgi:DNA-binding transcriptional MocR family regulator
MQELQEYHSKLQQKYNKFKDMKLKLDMSRGKPCSQQLDLSNGLLDCLEENDYRTADGTDCRNYGGIEGIAEARELFAQMLEVTSSEIIISSNASLNVMYDSIVRAMMFGVAGSETPWGKLPKVKFLCPSPGYDRHFAICELLNIEMIVVDMKSDGPDMDMVERLAEKDDAIKGIWCVPKYSNPQGITYSDEVVDRLARMKTKASDFRIFWDNAYVIHHLYDEHDSLKNIMTACKEAGNPDRVFIFGSTSKISFAGAGIAMMAASENNIGLIRKQMGIQTICPDKLNQLRHVRFFKSFDNIMTHMEKHAAILRPKFETVLDILERELGVKGIAAWNKPRGGYFVSLDTKEGCAKAVVAMAGEAGVTLTKAGATFPYGKDPLDRNIRIAPSYPPIDELRTAIELLCVCVQLVSTEKLIREKTCKVK